MVGKGQDGSIGKVFKKNAASLNGNFFYKYSSNSNAVTSSSSSKPRIYTLPTRALGASSGGRAIVTTEHKQLRSGNYPANAEELGYRR